MNRSGLKQTHGGSVKRQAFRQAFQPVFQVVKRPHLAIRSPPPNNKARGLASATTSSTGSCSVANTSRDGSLQPILGISYNDDILGTNLPCLIIDPRDITAISEEPLPEKYKDVKDFVMDEQKSSILFEKEAGKWVAVPLFEMK